MALSAAATVWLFVVGVFVFAFVVAVAVVAPAFALWLLLFAAIGVAIALSWRAVRKRRERALALAFQLHKDQRKAQPPIEDALGTFTCDGNRWSTVIARGDDEKIRIATSSTRPEDLRDALARDRPLVEALLADDTRYRLAAANLVLKTYNESWREAPAEMTAEELATYLTLRAVRISFEDHWAFVFFRANQILFGGHWVELVVDAKHEPLPDLGGITDERG